MNQVYFVRGGAVAKYLSSLTIAGGVGGACGKCAACGTKPFSSAV